MEHPRIAATGEGIRLFDADGMATPYLDEIAGRLGDLDEGYRASGAFYDALLAHDLLEPFSLEVTLDDGSIYSLVGFPHHRRGEAARARWRDARARCTRRDI